MSKSPFACPGVGLVAFGLLLISGCIPGRASNSPLPSLPGIKPRSESASPTGKTAAPTAEKQSRQPLEHVGQKDFDQQVLKSPVPVLVDFYAEWCKPCQAMGPVLEEVAHETPNVKIVKVNVDENRALADRYGVKSLPSMKLFKDGKVDAEEAGVTSKTKVKAMLST